MAARQRQIVVSAVNIRVHTKHHADEYIQLWHALWKLQQPWTRGTTGYMLGEKPRESKHPFSGEPLLNGYLYRFTNIDPNGQWLDMARRAPASPEELEDVSVPEHLKPNLSSIPYVFDPHGHTLYVLSGGADPHVSAGTVHRGLTDLCLYRSIVDRFGTVDLTVVTDKREVDAMLRWPTIKELEIYLQRPNAHEETDEAKVFERMNRRKTSAEIHRYVKDPAEDTLVVDEQLVQMAHIAADNGHVKVKGRNPSGTSEEADSKAFPLVAKGSYEPKKQTLMDGMVAFVVDRFMASRRRRG